jgi:AbrB family looped-hinge helix DNA binding protein
MVNRVVPAVEFPRALEETVERYGGLPPPSVLASKRLTTSAFDVDFDTFRKTMTEALRGCMELDEHRQAMNHGKINTMKTTIDAAGRLVIPKEIRREAGLKPGVLLEVRFRDGRIEIEPAPLPVKLVRKGRLLVAVPERNVGVLTSETVERTRRALRRERAERF